MRISLSSTCLVSGLLGLLVLLGLGVMLPLRAGAPVDSGRVCFWSFDGSLTDQAGGARDQLVARDGRGGRTTARFVTDSDLPATRGQAIVLGEQPGDAHYLTAARSADIELGSTYSVEMWIHPTRLGVWNRLALNWRAEPEHAYHVAIHNGLLSLYHGQSDGQLVCAEGGRIQAGYWYHVVAVARRSQADPTAGTLIVYLNGERAATARFDCTVGASDSEGLGVGDSFGAPSPTCRYRGYLDELSLWNRALSDEEIRLHYEERAELLAAFELSRQRLEMARRAKVFASIERYGCEEIVFAERAPGRDPSSHYYANFGYSCIDPTYWLHGDDGGRLCKLNLRTGKLTVLLADPGGAVRDPQVHYDAEKILFSYRRGGSHHYSLYEIRCDGSGLRQITEGPWDDIEPAYLPDGDIVFCSTRCRRWIGCWLAETATLHRCGADGEGIHMLSSGSFTENTPAVLPDGRVLYTRWEYVNRDPVSFHHLWTVNPDGTAQMVYFGNMHPGGVFIDAVPIPGTDRLVLIHSPGHGANEHAGYVATLTSKYGPDAKSALRDISRSGGFRDPYPLSEDAFLVAKGNQILLISSVGEAEVLYMGSDRDLHEPRPLVRRARETALPSRVDMGKTTATLVLHDVYSGRNMDGVEPGSIKKLLVLEDLPKPVNFHGGGSQPIGHGVTSTLKRILGTVPVEPDGSAHFEVPAMRSIYFVALDEADLSVKQMRSFVTLQPGETTSCVGCHEPRGRTPRTGTRALQALGRAPSRVEPIDDVPEIMDFPRDIQPILSRHCVRCHSYDNREGGVVLEGERGPVFSHSYYELFLHWQVKDTSGQPGHGSGRQPGNDRPYDTYSSASALMEKFDGSHYGVQPGCRDRKMIRLWIDAGAQYPGTYAAYGSGQVGGCWGNNRPVRVMADQWPSTPAAREAMQRRCGACHPAGQLPQHVTDRIPLDPWGDMLSWVRPLSRYSRHRLYNLSRPEKSLILLAPLAQEAGGYADGRQAASDAGPPQVQEDRNRPPRPVVHPDVFAHTDDPDYQKILTHIRAAKAKLEEIKRFDMPGFRPNEHYVREMKRYGALSPSFDPDRDSIDVYAIDRAYWRAFWHRPAASSGSPSSGPPSSGPPSSGPPSSGPRESW